MCVCVVIVVVVDRGGGSGEPNCRHTGLSTRASKANSKNNEVSRLKIPFFGGTCLFPSLFS